MLLRLGIAVRTRMTAKLGWELLTEIFARRYAHPARLVLHLLTEWRHLTWWASGEELRNADFKPSFHSVRDALDDTLMASPWSLMQNERLYRKQQTIRVEIFHALPGCIEVFHNQNRRHSTLGYVSRIGLERMLDQETDQLSRHGGSQARSR